MIRKRTVLFVFHKHDLWVNVMAHDLVKDSYVKYRPNPSYNWKYTSRTRVSAMREDWPWGYDTESWTAIVWSIIQIQLPTVIKNTTWTKMLMSVVTVEIWPSLDQAHDSIPLIMKKVCVSYQVPNKKIYDPETSFFYVCHMSFFYSLQFSKILDHCCFIQ